MSSAHSFFIDLNVSEMKLQSFLIQLLCLVFLTHCNVNAQESPGPSQTNDYAYFENFNSSVAMVIVFLVCAFFVVGFFSIFITHCAEMRIANTGGSLGAAAANGAAFAAAKRRGIDPTVIEKFPMFVYSEVKDLKIGKGALECAVCLSEFEDYETLRLLPKCDHVFHPDCIDAWLASHITCPVCRAKLAPDSNDTVTEPNNNSNHPESRNEISNDQQQNNEVVINVSENQSNEAAEIENRPVRSGIFGKFPRSHSTGHSVVQPGENTERYTLRLPDSVRRQLVSSRNKNLKRSTSYDVILPRLGSSRKGYRLGGEGSSSRGKNSVDHQTGRFDPWLLLKTPPFFGRGGGGSVKSTKNGVDGEVLYVKPLLTPVNIPLDCQNFIENRSQEPMSRPPV